MLRRSFRVLVFSSASAFGSVLVGEMPGAAPKTVPLRSPAPAGAFGGEIQQTLIPTSAFMPALSGYSYESDAGNDLSPTVGGGQRWLAPLGLPSGAAIEEIRILVRDEDDGFDIRAWLIFVARAIDGSNTCDQVLSLAGWNETTEGMDGHGVMVLQDDEPYLVRTQDHFPPSFCDSENYLFYSLMVELVSPDHGLAGAVVRWRRTVSPAPSAATFNDVPTDHPFFQFVEALAESGITAGCGGGNYCPENPLTRGQMAVFLAKALGLHWPL